MKSETVKVKSLRYIAALFVVSSFVGLQAQTDVLVTDSAAHDTAAVVLPWPRNIQARLDTLVMDPMLEATQLGMYIYDLTADSVLYTYGAKQTLRPASTMKLLTSITALDLLGGDYNYRTTLRYTGQVKDSVLLGNLYCVGGLDPLFDDVDMDAFVESVKGLGVKTVRGKLYADNSFKEPELLGEGWCWDDDNPHLAPLLVSRKDDFISQFKDRMMKAGIVVEADSASGTPPKDALALSSRIHSLREVLVPMMKESDNLYAESMFYQVAASMGARPAKASHGKQLIKKVLGKAGVTGVQYKIADGSGLSLYNYVTPELLAKLLIYAYRHTKINVDLFPSLPIAGQDGTLKKRMINSVANGRVRAKTGTVTGVSSLAGYASLPNGHQLVFAIINQGIMKSADGRGFQDRVCTALCEP